jgi:hypothetical protein
LVNDSHAGCKVNNAKLVNARASLEAGGLTLEVKVGGTNADGSAYYRLTDDRYGFAATYLFRKTWLDRADIDHLTALGHTLTEVA